MKSESKPLIHFHTDCDFFAGCELMMANILNDAEFKRQFNSRLSFRTSAHYLEGLAARVPQGDNLLPLQLPNAESWSRNLFRWDGYFSRSLSAVATKLLELPFAIFDFVILFRLLKETPPALLHINNGGYPGALSCRLAALAGKLARVPVQIMVVNNLAVDYGPYSRKTDLPLDRLIARYVSKFVTGSTVAAQRLEQVLKLPESKLRVINNGVKIAPAPVGALPKADKTGTRFGIVAHHVQRKGHMVLLKAIAELRDTGMLEEGDPHFLIEGVGPENENIHREISRLKLENFVEMVGRADAIHDFMRTLDVLVLPSVANEDFPNVISEAMGLGIPVIATRIGGIPEQILHDEIGLLINANDSGALARALYFAATNPSWREVAGRNGLSHYDRSYRVEAAVGKYIDLYDELIHGGAKWQI